MSFRFLKNLFGTDAKTRTRTPATRLNVESLEARDVPAMVNLTTAGSSGVLNGAIFEQINTPSSATLQSFVRIDANGVEQGYNTDARPVQFDERPNANVTRSLHKDNVPVVNIGGVNYLEFVLDINQTVANPRLSLDELRIYVGDVGNLSNYRPNRDTLGGLTAVYDMDAGPGNNWVQLNANLNRGGTSGDMRLLVPETVFAGGSFIYLYSKFGVNRSANGGYEQWSVRQAAPTLGSISGLVFYDPQEGPDEALPGYTVYIDIPDQDNPTGNNVLDWVDAGDLNGVWDAGEGEQWTITDANGNYTLSGLAAGTYHVRVIDPDFDGLAVVGGTLFPPFTLGPGEPKTGVNFRFVDAN
jgi:hypothetical protein